jgi:hypothetical protein
MTGRALWLDSQDSFVIEEPLEIGARTPLSEMSEATDRGL